MSMIFVSPDFPLNRRMRKAIRRGKLQVFREGGARSALGGGIASKLIPPFRTFSSSLVCFASREGDSGAMGGGGGEEEAAFLLYSMFARACDSGSRFGPEDAPYSAYWSLCDSHGREEVDKRIWKRLCFF